jgi:hypothetical protein
MKILALLAAVAATGLSGGAFAACTPPVTGTALKAIEITAALNGNTACVGTSPQFEAQEQHRSVDELWDYKLGAGHAVDPTKKIGTWKILPSSTADTTGTINYTYDGSSTPYTYTVYNIGPSTYCFVGTSNVEVKVKSGIGSCP